MQQKKLLRLSMKLLKTTVTKKQRKKLKQKNFSVFLILLGLLLITASLFYFAFLEEKQLYINPLSYDQTSKNSEIEKNLKEKNISFKTIVTTKDLNYIIRLDDQREVILDSKKDIVGQLSSLQLIISQLTIEGKMFKSLDFRYQKPIIKF